MIQEAKIDTSSYMKVSKHITHSFLSIHVKLKIWSKKELTSRSSSWKAIRWIGSESQSVPSTSNRMASKGARCEREGLLHHNKWNNKKTDIKILRNRHEIASKGSNFGYHNRKKMDKFAETISTVLCPSISFSVFVYKYWEFRRKIEIATSSIDLGDPDTCTRNRSVLNKTTQRS